MGSSTNTCRPVIVLGDRNTTGLSDVVESLMEQATAHGAVIAECYSFNLGEARSQDDLAEVGAVVSALGRAIALRADVWVPFPMIDLGREQHVRRVSLVLQRHGVNMLIGPTLEPCTRDGGFSEIDFALRSEVRAVDGLDNAVLAATGASTLCEEIEQALRRLDHPRHRPATPPGPAGEPVYGSREVAAFFGRSVQWVSRGLRANVFTRPDGSPVEPIRVGGRAGPRRFTLPMLRDMVDACYRRGTLNEDELLDLLAVLARAEQE